MERAAGAFYSGSVVSIRVALTVVLAAACAVPATADEWIEIVSPHFTVVSNARRGRAWTVADEFERIRSVYETALTLPPSESETPVLIFAVTDEASFRELAPWLGELLPAGMFAKNDEGARIVLRLDFELQAIDTLDS